MPEYCSGSSKSETARDRERERGRVLEFGLEFSKPAHTRPQMHRTQALIIIQNWTFRLTYSPLSTEEKNMKKETNNREKKQTSNTFDQSHVTWGQLGDVDVGLSSCRGSTR